MKNNERDERKTRKVLVPLATLAVAAAVAVGSGATFTSQTGITASVTAGKLLHSNNKNGQTLTVTKLKPGDQATGTVTLSRGTNSNLSSDLKLVFSNVSSAFESGAVKITVVGNGQSGVIDLEDTDGGTATVNLGHLAANWDSRNVDITVSMPLAADDDNQGATGSADIAFVQTATAGTTDQETTATWVAPPTP